MGIPKEAEIMCMGFRQGGPEDIICEVVLEEGYGSTFTIRERQAGKAKAEATVVMGFDDIPKLIALLQAVDDWWTARKASGLGDEIR